MHLPSWFGEGADLGVIAIIIRTLQKKVSDPTWAPFACNQHWNGWPFRLTNDDWYTDKISQKFKYKPHIMLAHTIHFTSDNKFVAACFVPVWVTATEKLYNICPKTRIISFGYSVCYIRNQLQLKILIIPIPRMRHIDVKGCVYAYCGFDNVNSVYKG